MDNPREFYAWVRIIDDAAAAGTEPEMAPADLQSCSVVIQDLALDSGMTVLGGTKWPPPKPTSIPDPIKGSDVQQCADAASGALVTILDPDVWGGWAIDEDFAGYGGRSFELIQVLGGRDAAVKWLFSPDGQAWVGQAENLALIRFTAPLPPSSSSNRADAPAPAPAAVKHGNFPFNEWRPPYLRAAKHTAGSLVDPAWVETALLDPRLNQWPDELHEMPDVRAAMTEQKDRITQIRRLSLTTKSMAYVLAGDDDKALLTRPASHALLKALRSGLAYTLYQMKLRYNRTRPWIVDPTLDLAIRKWEEPFPAHAAYPAGHAFYGYTLALLFGEPDPSPRFSEMLSRAYHVSRDRIIAGLHFPRDVEAGRTLAEMVVPVLRANSGFKALVDAAKREW